MRIAVILPRHMKFSPLGATSIDLCAHDLALFSRYKNSTVIYGCHCSAPFRDVAFVPVGSGHQVDRAQVKQALKDDRPDVIVVHQHLRTATQICEDFPSTPVVLHRHGRTKQDKLLRRLLNQRHYGELEAILWVSTAIRTAFLQQYPQFTDRSWVVPNGIDTTLWVPTKKENRLAYVGRARDDKGLSDLLEGVRRAGLDGWTLDMVLAIHDAEERATAYRLKQEAVRLGLSRIRFWENLSASQVRGVLGAARIAVAPSRVQEGFGRVVIEAMSCGAAVVATPSGGFKEAGGSHAFYVRPNSPQDIAGALQALVSDPAQCEERGRMGRQHVMRHFDVRSVARQFDEMMETVVHGVAATRRVTAPVP